MSAYELSYLVFVIISFSVFSGVLYAVERAGRGSVVHPGPRVTSEPVRAVQVAALPVS